MNHVILVHFEIPFSFLSEQPFVLKIRRVNFRGRYTLRFVLRQALPTPEKEKTTKLREKIRVDNKFNIS